MDAIVAVYSDWGIGSGGTQPIVLRADRAHFKRITEGRTVIVGRRTLADLPGGRPLSGRRTVVLSSRCPEIEGALIARSAEEAVSLCGGDAVIIGGASVYRALLPFTDRVFVTKLGIAPPSDSFFPDLDSSPEWRLADAGEELFENGISFRFTVYERRSDDE